MNGVVCKGQKVVAPVTVGRLLSGVYCDSISSMFRIVKEKYFTNQYKFIYLCTCPNLVLFPILL